MTITHRFSQLSLKEKVAQMLMLGFRGLAVDDNSPVYRDITELGIGGVVLFDVDVPTKSAPRNIQSPEQLAALTTQLQSISNIPLIIAVDQEGGQVARLKPAYGFPQTVSHQWLGQQDCLAVTRSRISDMASTLASCGITLNFSPCVDLRLNPNNPIIAGKERSFSHDPNSVISHAIEFIKAHHQHDVRCTLKHFPGHGSSKDDSHFGFVDVTDSWWPDELAPYKKLVHLELVDAVMTAHVYHAKLDSEFPATLSNNIINGILRTDIKFDGLVFTDDLQMQAITQKYALETAIEKALHAGVDIVLFGNNYVYDEDIAEKVIGIMVKLVGDGRITENKIDESIARIALFKSNLKNRP